MSKWKARLILAAAILLLAVWFVFDIFKIRIVL